MGFSEDIYGKFNRLFSLASADRKKMSEGELSSLNILQNALTPKGEEYFGHFDRNLESIMQKDVKGRDFAELLSMDVDNPAHTGPLAYIHNPWKGKADELHKMLSQTGNVWVDKMLAHIIGQNSHLSLDELALAIAENKVIGDYGSGIYSINGVAHWAFLPIVRSLLSIRMALAMFQTKVQKDIEQSIMLFGGEEILEGEQHFLRNVQRMLLADVYVKTDEENKEFAGEFWKKLLNIVWGGARKNDDLLESTRILFEKLRTMPDSAMGEFFSALIGKDKNERIRNILDTIAPYTKLMQDNDALKAGGLDMTRDKIAELMLNYPNAIGLLLGSGEIAEAFSNADGKPTTVLDDKKRIEQLKLVFSQVDNSLEEAMNTRLQYVLENLDDISKEDNTKLRQQVEELLDKVEDTDWNNKIMGKIKSGLMFQSEYDALKKKLTELQDELIKHRIGWDTSRNGKTVILIASGNEKSLSEIETEDSAAGCGATITTPQLQTVGLQ